MVRKQLLVTAEQNRRLKALAGATGRSEGAVVRAAIDRLLAEEAVDSEDWKTAWRQAAGTWKDRDDLDQFYAERRERRRLRRERMMRLMASNRRK